MDEIMDTGVESVDETSQQDAFLAGWDDVDDAPAEESVEGAEEAEVPAENAEEGNTSPEAEKPETPADETPSEPPVEQPKTFELEYMGKKVSKNEEEMKSLAQKGMDYDRIRNAYDDAKPIISLAKHCAEQAGMTLAEYARESEKDILMKSGKTEAEAVAEMDMRQREEALKQFEDKQRAEREEKAAAEAKNKADMEEFSKAYPSVVSAIASAISKGEDASAVIPAEVWEDTNNGLSLTSAYAKYEAKKSREEAAALREELAAAKKNNENRLTSTGSMSSAGNGSVGKKDPFLEGWDS